ncbi:MAG: mltG, partial [Hyphomicrobiales bacterium]|nr:mltG [Hyphomicrobiales bacterium]
MAGVLWAICRHVLDDLKVVVERMVEPTDHPKESETPRSGARFFQRAHLQSPSEALHPAAPPEPPAPPQRPSKRRPTLSALSGFLSFLLVAAIAAAIGVGFGQQKIREPGPLQEDKVLFVAPRTEVPEILAQLEREGVIDMPILLNLALWLEGNRSNVKAGEYLFKREASLRDVIDTLVSGKQVLHSITIPEGLTSEQIVQRLRDSDVLIGDIRDIPKEGLLLPETYRVARGMARGDLLRKMQDEQRKLLDQIWSRRSPDLSLRTPYELVTLASIVEKETGRADERTRVASVFLNRLSKRMRLQSDPTIVYGLVGGKGTLGRGITRAEITQPSAYNTYVIDGLPPGPIANPGRAALEAVANPSRTKDLYFVADGTGGHAFAETLDQHSRNVTRWRQIEKDTKDSKADTSAAGDVDRAPPVVPGEAGAPPAAPATPSTPAKRGQRGALETPAPGANQMFGALPQMGPNGVAGFFGLSGPATAGASLDLAEKAPSGKAPAKAADARKADANGKPMAKATQPRGGPSFALGPGIEELGINIAGVTDRPVLDGPDSGDNTPTDPTLYPVGPQRLAEQNARAAKLGLKPTSADLSEPAVDPDAQPRPLAMQSQQSAGTGPRRITDASEGTALDPLLNKSWDLNS